MARRRRLPGLCGSGRLFVLSLLGEAPPGLRQHHLKVVGEPDPVEPLAMQCPELRNIHDRRA